MEYRQELEIQTLLKELVMMKGRITKLLTQARDGLHIIQDAKVEVARQAKEVEEQKEQLAKLDLWLETINNGLKETTIQTDVLTEEDIIRYIEIYERYIREYEEYEIILKSITVISRDESSQSLRVKLIAMQKALEDTKHLVIIEIERLRQVLLHIRTAPEVVEDDISQTDRTIDSTSMPEEVVTPRESEVPEKLPSKREVEKVVPTEKATSEDSAEKVTTIQESKPSHEKPQPVPVEVQVVKETAAIETQTGKSLISDPPSVTDKSVICRPDVIATHDVSITCAPPQEVEVQTSEPHSDEKEILENIQVRQTISDGHETIEIASRPVYREQRFDDQSLFVDANYRDDNLRKDSQLNITHSLPQAFETVMVEPDETTTEVVVDADGTKRIIVKKIRKTLVTRQQTLQTQQHRTQILSADMPQESFSQITLQEDKGSTSTTMDDGGIQRVQYQTYGGQVISSLPGGEVTIQEITSKPDIVFTMEQGMRPEDILQLAEGEVPQIQTSSSSVTAVVQQVTKRIVKTRRRIIRRIVIIDGKEHVTEEVIDEPDNVEVFEEQIPRVSISVKDRGDVLPGTEEDDDSDKKDDHPAIPPRKEKPSDKKPDDSEPKDDKPDDKDIKVTEKIVTIPGDITQAQLDQLMQEFIQKEGGDFSQVTKSETVRTSQSRETTPVTTVTFSETYQTLPEDSQSLPQETMYLVQEPLEGQTTFTTEGVQHSTLETSSTNVATVVQKVTRKITRTRRRIIKHIQIIDGKEHVTEEVIDEPDDVEVIEEEPRVSHSIQTEGVKNKRVKIIKQVQIIDGKEHVTEQIVEEPDDEYIPESTMTADIEVKLSKPDMEVIKEESVQLPTTSTKTVTISTKDSSVVDVTNKLIGSEMDQSTVTLPKTKKPEHKDYTITEENITSEIQEPADATIHIIKQTVVTEPYEILTTTVTKEETPIEDQNITETVTTLIPSVGQPENSLIDITKSLIGSEINHSTASKLPVTETTKEVKETLTKDGIPIKETIETIQTQPDLTVVKKKVIVTEPAGEETKTVTITTSEILIPDTLTKDVTDVPLTTEQEILKTSVQEIVEGSKDEMPKAIKDADIVMQKIQETIQTTEPDVIVSMAPTVIETTKYTKVNDQPTITETITKTQVVSVTEPEAPKDTSLIDVTKSLLSSEIDHSAVSKVPTKPVQPKPEGIKDKKVSFKDVNVPKKTEDKSNKFEEALEQPISDKPAICQELPKPTETTTEELVKSENTTVFLSDSVVENRKDTTAIDFTKNLIGSEIDHSTALRTPEKGTEKPKQTDEDKVKKPKDDKKITISKEATEPGTVTAESVAAESVPVDSKPQQIESISRDVTTQIHVISKPTEKTVIIEKPDVTVYEETPSKVTEIIVEEPTKVKETTVITENTVTEVTRDVTELTTDKPKDTSVIDITKSLIDSEIDHSATSKIPIQPIVKTGVTKSLDDITKQEKPEDKLMTITSPEKPVTSVETVVQKGPESQITVVRETVELRPDSVDPKSPVVLEPMELKPESVVERPTISSEIPVELKPALETSKSVISQITDNTITEVEKDESISNKSVRDTTLIDITKSLIGSETDHSVISKKPAKPVTVEELPKEVTDVPTIETSEITEKEQTTVFTAPDITTTTTVTKVVKEIEPEAIIKGTMVTEDVEETTEITADKPEQPEVLKPKSEPHETTKSDKPSLPGSEKETVRQETITFEDVTPTAPKLEEIIGDFPTEDNFMQQYEKPHTNILELTKQLLDSESIHTGTVPAVVKIEETPIKFEESKPTDISVVPSTIIKPVAEVADKLSEPQDPIDHLEKPKEIDVTSSTELPIVPVPPKNTDQDAVKQDFVKPVVPKDQDQVKEFTTETRDMGKIPDVPEFVDDSKPPKSVPVSLELVKDVQAPTPTVQPSEPEYHPEDVLLDTTKQPQVGVVHLTKELIIHEGLNKYEQEPVQVAPETIFTETTNVSRITTEKAPTQSTIEVEPLKVGNIITETDTTKEPEAPEISYIRQFEPQVQGSSESVNKLLATFEEPEQKSVPSQTAEFVGTETTSRKPDEKFDVNILLNSERQDTDLRGFKPVTSITQDKPQQSVDISMSLTKTDETLKTQPKVKFDLKVEEFETSAPTVVIKDIDVVLPSDVKITKEQKVLATEVVEKDQPITEATPEESIKDHKRSKKRKKRKPDSASSQSIEIDTHTETDKSVADTDSSSLSHYVELPSSPPVESPKPTEEVLEPVEAIPEKSPVIDVEKIQPSPEVVQLEPEDSSLAESEPITEEKGYEPEDLSLGPIPTPDKKKKHKKRKTHGVSEDTTYPKLSTTETEDISVSAPVEAPEPVKKGKDKKRKKKTPVVTEEEKEPSPVHTVKDEPEPEVEPEPMVEPEIKPESPKIGTETVATSPKDESYHTISETSDISTVKIVEECIQSSPEVAEKEVPTTVTFPVPVVEEIATQEYSIQTSPEETEPVEELPRPETSDIELQTTPTSVSEVVTQTTPVEDKEADTQTIEEVTTVVEKIMSDSEMQTSRTETPEQVIQTEATTQVIPHDIITPDDKFSQTSPVVEEPPAQEQQPQKIEIDTESREMQTSPLPEIKKDEKSTEVLIETTETDIQTVKQEITDQETSTTPVQEKETIEMSMQTPEVPLVSTFTQSDEPEPAPEIAEPVEKLEVPTLPQLEIVKKDLITVDSTQQTSPRGEFEEAPPKLELKEVITLESSQQTTPREPEVPAPIPEPKVTPKHEVEAPKREVITVDSTQQTSPREPSERATPVPILNLERRDVITTDTTQQTSPRFYSEDSISTSTDEPYEVHLRAQISIPQATTGFIESERSFEEPSQSILGDKYKQKKRKSKKKTESPLLQSPESLSDPINAELSMSVTPTSDDISSKETSSIDEGISQLASPMMPRPMQPKLTYSDVVQRSKSKSPSPSKTVVPYKTKEARLLDALEKRTHSATDPQNTIPDDSMTVALLDPSVERSYELVVDKELEEVKNAIETHDPTRTERSVIIVIETISIWLEEIQYKIQRETISGIKSTVETERLKSLKKQILYLKQIIEITEVNEEIITLIETLTRQVDAVNTLSNQSSVKVKEVEKEWIKFLDDTDKLSESVERVKNTLDDIILSDMPTQQKLDKLDKIEVDNFDNFETVRKMFKRCRSLIEANPKRECPIKLYDCDDDTKQADNTINTERDRLLQLTSLAEEYEQTLQDFGQITDVAEALLDGKIIVSDLDHLYEEIQKHRKFFVNLSHCRAILESLEDNLDNETRSKYASLHNSLHDRATVIIDRAASRAQQMTLAASRWTLLQRGMKEEQQWLIVAQQRVPDLTNVTSMDHEQYINLYQSISLDISHHYAKMLRLLSITDGLQNLIVCSGLETECSVALDTLLKLQEDVDSRLTRLTAFKENWVTFDHLIDRIEGWMKIANRELEFITPENITTTGNLRRFWELKAQHEVHNNLKTEAGIQFEKALEILPVSDEMVQREFFSKIEDKWRDLASRIGNIHATAIQNISDRDVSSGEKLNILEEELRELRSAVEGLKGVIRSEDELSLYIERLQVMTGRIDRIQNELGRLSLLPTAESERLGALLSQSGILEDLISEELERSMLLKEKIVQVQAGIARCQKSQRRARLTLEECESAERLGSDVVERASQTCDRLVEELASQWRDILALRQALHTLPTSLRVVVSPTGVERDISALQETHAELEAACSELSSRLRAKLQLWRRFERQLELVQGAVREADYMVELLTVQGQVDYDRLLKATEQLETLSESLSRRSGELVGELREAAAPLEASIEPSVAAGLRRDLDDAAAAYHHTCTNLTQLCDKYHKAVELWKRYRDAAAAVRAFADAQEATLHALRPDDAPVTAQACLEQEARVAELRSLAARVAAETGSRALQADADALARRLQLVAGAVQALADLGEARQVARAKAHHAKEQLCDMRQDLTPLHEDGEIVEDKLIALRDNLIALGKSEADIAPAKAELPDIDRDVSDEHSIVRILELWQAMFRDTFLHYHRLSTALVRSGDAATALRLWHEYLLDLQSFLSGSVPADYENLTEHRRLCRVHRNLLTSQRSVLMNENRETKNRDLADKFDTMTNLHNETLARIVERHDEVCTRISAWDDYREVHTELLRWLKEMEREKEKLQLRYVHIKRVNKILSKIQNLSDKVPEGRRQTEKLLVDLKKVLEFTEEAYGASVRMEYAGTVKRVDNLQASLDTWRDFLSRILGLIGEYEKLSNDLHRLYSKTQDDIISYSDEERQSRPQLKKAIDRYTDLRTKIEKTEIQIEALSVIQEQLKECLSPQDIRLVNQRVWQLRQQRADLEHQLSIIIHRLQERLEVYTIFDSRLTRFIQWITTLETRLETSSQSSEIGAIDPHDLIRRINSEVQAETAMKEREFEWLTETGASLVELAKKDEKSYCKNTSKHLKDVQERWHKMQETSRSRIAKINELLETITQLEQRLTEIRLKLHSIESNISAPVVLEHLTAKAVDEKFRDRDDIHKSIEDESGQVGETLNLCELVFNDPDTSKGNFDLRNLRTGVDIVEKKWRNICDMSEQRKNALKEIRKSAELANSLLPKIERRLDAVEKRVEKIETRKQRGEPEDESVSRVVAEELDGLEPDVNKLEEAYGRIAAARGVELRGAGADGAARLRAAVRRWQRLRARLHAAAEDAHRQFVAAHGSAVVALAEVDVRLTRALHLAPAPMDKPATLRELDGVERELRDCESLVEEADRLAAAVATLAGVADMVAEYRALFADVRTRLDLARAEVVGDVDSAVQVDTLIWETDASFQVDTLTSKETYRAELTTAVKETSDALEALRTALLNQPQENAGGDELATAAKEIAKAGAKPAQTLELAKHLSELLLTECDATEDEAMMKEVESLSLRYEDLLTQAKKRELQINNLRLPHSASYALTCEHESGRLTCPLCSERNWKQLDNDLWRLEQWLQFAEATEAARTDPPEQYDLLEDAIQDHREFLLDLDSHKSIVVSLNVVGAHVAQHAASAAAGERVRARLAAANSRWNCACARAAAWQARLQHALVHNQEFHDNVVELVSQLGAAERTVRAREPLRLARAAAELQRDFRLYSELRDELQRNEPRVLALHDAAQLLRTGDAPQDADDICRRLGELRLRLQSLRKLSGVYALKLGAALARQPAPLASAVLAAAAAAAPAQLVDDEDESMSGMLPPLDDEDAAASSEAERLRLTRVQRGLRFVCRVARASLPFQALLLLLLGAAALAPHANSDCQHSAAGLALDPVLRFPDGPPPL